jgi:hypothetical protein
MPRDAGNAAAQLRPGPQLQSPPMTSRERISSSGTRFLAPLIAGLGLAIIIRTVAAGGGVLSAGVLLGAIFVAIGAGRLYLLNRAGS